MNNLTREQVLALPPGRELDALICERVMGWTFRPAHRLSHWTGGEPTAGMMPDAWYDADGYCRSCSTGPWLAFSTDVAVAWRVVEKLRLGVAWHNGEAAVFQTAPGAIFPWDELSIIPLCKKPEAAHAICLGALLLVTGNG
jgi:hypothetical protein